MMLGWSTGRLATGRMKGIPVVYMQMATAAEAEAAMAGLDATEPG